MITHRPYQLGPRPIANGLLLAAEDPRDRRESSYSTKLSCPKCGGPVFAPADSTDEAIVCQGCTSLLTTRLERGVLHLEISPDDATTLDLEPESEEGGTP